MMGSGKSSVGAPLADRLGMTYVDTDARIVARHDMTISEIFTREGEPWFRTEEERLIAEVAEDATPAVVATGGGVILSDISRETMHASGLVVWLFADLATIIGRVGMAEDRPLIGRANPVASMDQLMTARYELYSDAADGRVSTIDRDIADVIDEVESLWQSR